MLIQQMKWKLYLSVWLPCPLPVSQGCDAFFLSQLFITCLVARMWLSSEEEPCYMVRKMSRDGQMNRYWLWTFLRTKQTAHSVCLVGLIFFLWSATYLPFKVNRGTNVRTVSEVMNAFEVKFSLPQISDSDLLLLLLLLLLFFPSCVLFQLWKGNFLSLCPPGSFMSVLFFCFLSPWFWCHRQPSLYHLYPKITEVSNVRSLYI